ncbi:hypothetical protein BDZ89DRAFT_1163411 [Hymenopellis radicata]|nr:hypothetical protein BDZ89DRAFT_1163411 [Hymenopellis radicata]
MPRPPATLADLEVMCEAIKNKSPADISDNLRTALAVIKDAGEAIKQVPYIKAVAGVLGTLVSMKVEMDDCQDAWDTALRDIARAMIKIMELYLDFQDAGRVKRAFNRKAWRAKADQCSRDLNSVMQIFNSDIGISTFLLIQSLTVLQPQTFISAQHVLAYDAPSQYFVGRQDILLQLKSIFEISASKGCIISLCGKGGSGKTQIALKFVSETQAMFKKIWFIDAASYITLNAAFKVLAKAIGLEKSDFIQAAPLDYSKPLEVDEWVKPVYEYLSCLQERWLIILDNADDPNLKLPQYVPQCIFGYILITSRLSDQWASPNCRINCDDLSEKDAIDLLLKRTDIVLTEENYQVCFQNCIELGYYALAIATAGAYIRSNITCTLENYLEQFYAQQSDFINDDQLQRQDSYQRTIYATFLLSFKQLSHAAHLFMQICSFYHILLFQLLYFLMH